MVGDGWPFQQGQDSGVDDGRDDGRGRVSIQDGDLFCREIKRWSVRVGVFHGRQVGLEVADQEFILLVPQGD